MAHYLSATIEYETDDPTDQPFFKKRVWSSVEIQEKIAIARRDMAKQEAKRILTDKVNELKEKARYSSDSVIVSRAELFLGAKVEFRFP